MSRLAKEPIQLPKNVEVKIAGQKVDVKGPKGSLSVLVSEGVNISLSGTELMLSASETLEHFPFLGLSRGLILNAVIGVTTGFEKKLELVGVGYKAAIKGDKLDMSLGFSHPCQLSIPKGIEVKIEKGTQMVILGMDRQVVGQFAASIRALKKPEPYKGKGVRYQGEVVRRKAGKKTAK